MIALSFLELYFYILKACFDIRQSSEFWKRMSTIEEKIPEALSTHPASEHRALDLEALIPAVNQRIVTFINI